jgi:hypothetical protein
MSDKKLRRLDEELRNLQRLADDSERALQREIAKRFPIGAQLKLIDCTGIVIGYAGRDVMYHVSRDGEEWTKGIDRIPYSSLLED